MYISSVVCRACVFSLMNALLGPPDQSYMAPPIVLLRDEYGHIRAAPRDLLDSMITEIALNYQGPSGAPPASESAVRSLPRRKITEEDVAREETCPVCLEQYKLEEEMCGMPCDHSFHTDCLIPWLRNHNNCPICRLELPTDDLEYEEQRAQRERTHDHTGSSG